jgi:hypothetical protein
VNTEAALSHDIHDLIDSNLACIIDFKSAARNKAAIMNSEYQGLEERLVLAVERAIHKHVLVVRRPGQDVAPS